MPQGLARVIALSPFARPDPCLVVAASRAGALGVMDLGLDRDDARRALNAVSSLPFASIGVRFPQHARFDQPLPACVGLVVVDAAADLRSWRAKRVLVQVTSLDEARHAVAAGACGIICKGSESGGRIGEQSSFVLLQSLVREIALPIWVQGGIGFHTAGACVAGGAAGVVLDAQLALARESTLPESLRTVVAAMDGSETIVVDGYRVYARPDLPVRDLAAMGDPGERLGWRDLHRFLLPAGQDTALAAPFAERYRAAGAMVRGIERAMDGSIVLARKQPGFGVSNALARDLHTPSAILQGPMTRVSDRAPFAAAVADAGAIPFIALALMRSAEVSELLEETSRRLAGRCWGVGILGFVPPELRDEQLEVVRRIKPPLALIAGGRPAQAISLDELGIKSFLHVPSPGLLDLFLKQGARRFVFEGSECGGHVGPRTSFALWESQIDRLLRHARPEELSVVFAGGIHDARSAAMVAVIAAPLIARGAKVGVLMGTAYLFTDEVVECGAIQPAFRQAALDCNRTVLLETAPGHATRCAENDYVRAFRAEREKLRSSGLTQRDIWEKLETLNLGRLRLAAKGVRRDGDALVDVDAETQRREGMIMLGQVAALRTQRTTLARLHREIDEGARDHLAAIDVETSLPQEAGHDRDVAIVGMAAIMPGAPDLAAFWTNIVAGVNSIREVPPERWRVETFYDPASMSGRRTPSKWGGFIDAVAFDPLIYGIPPLSLAAIEPVQLLALEVSRRALDDAGYLDREFDRENTAVIFGAEAGTDLAGAYGFRALWQQYVGDMPDALDAVLPTMTEDSFAGILSNVIAGRVANRLDLRGANFTVDAACASSLAAVDAACKELWSGTSNLVICGGADLHNGIADYLAFASVHALSPRGQCMTFDASADGIALGEGVAAVVLKRRVDAQRDGDRIYAVIKGVGAASDGKSLGLTAPRAEGQARTLARAYANAAVAPETISLVEAHGTGTVVGDRTELETLDRFFAGAGASPGAIAIGSVKSQIGHTKCAAGLAGMIKSALAVYHRTLPPTINITQPNPAWHSGSPLALSTSARPWPARVRHAGVSAFGFGGTNFHVVLANHDDGAAPGGLAGWPAELFLFRGEDRAGALQRVEMLAALLDDSAWLLKDLARSTSTGIGRVHLAIVARDLADLREKLALARSEGSHAGGFFVANDRLAPDAKLALLFPGQGSQRVGMLRELFVAFPDLQRFLALGEEWCDKLFPPDAWSDEAKSAQREAINDTRTAQPVLGMVELAVADLLQRMGVHADCYAGHSYGELVALCAAGALPEAQLLGLSALRGQRILEACRSDDPGTMAAVAADASTARRYLDDASGVVVANENAPDQCVISGPGDAVRAATVRMVAAGIGVRAIPVRGAFHSPLVAGATETFARDLDKVSIGPLHASVYSNTTAARYADSPEEIRALLAAHIGRPVRFAAQVEAMYADGVRVFIEAGPGRVLTGLVARILGSRPHLAVACDRAGENALTQFLLALGALAAHGVAIDIDSLFDGRGAARFELASPPDRRPASSCWWVNGQRAWPMHGELPPHAMRPVRGPVVTTPAVSAAAPVAADRQAAVIDYLRNLRELADAQRRVMLAYLGAPEAGVAADAGTSLLSGPPPFQEAVASLPPVQARAAHGSLEETTPNLATAPTTEVGGPIDLSATLLAVVAERTGYPIEMLGLDLDLEADLSIDSIKRVEILGAVAERLGARLATGMESLPENLVAIKTLRGIAQALAPFAEMAHADRVIAPGSLPPPVPVLAPSAQSSVAAALPTEAADPAASMAVVRTNTPSRPVSRFVLQNEPAWHVKTGWRLADRSIGIVGASAAVERILIANLNAAGSKAFVLRNGHINGTPVDALLDLTPLRADWKPADIGDLFGRARDALVAGASHVLVAGTGNAPDRAGNGVAIRRAAERNGTRAHSDAAPAAAGVSGMMKSLRKEWPDRHVRVARFPSNLASERLIEHLVDELASPDTPVEVGYSLAGARHSPRIVAADWNGEGKHERSLQLHRDSVVLITGGARGITALVAVEMAHRYRCHLELVGRTPWPGEVEDADLADACDARAIRQRLIARGSLHAPAAIEAACAGILAGREIRSTVAKLAAAGARVRYRALDVRDADAFGAFIDEVYAHHGRLDGVIHGAGIIEDKLARDKSFESFARVFDTKVNGALAIARKVRDDIAFVVFFSSIAATFGSRGQSDYAAANDCLDHLAVDLKGRLRGRVLSINWGPWRTAGMMSDELAREYARRGIELIDPDAGVASFIEELLRGPGHDAQVILMSGDPSALM